MPSDLTAATTPAPRVVAVVVTWNRRELLTEAVDALRAQTLAPVEIVVVNNASTDDTAALLDSAYGDDLDVVHLRENTGGAGGFTVGIERALGHHPDLVWLLDDDTVPTPGAGMANWRERLFASLVSGRQEA